MSVTEDVKRGFKALDDGDLQTASEVAQAAMNADPAHTGALMLSGRVALIMARPDLAMMMFQTLIARPEATGETYLNLGRTFIALRQDERALAAFREATRRDPALLIAWQSLAETYLSANDRENAASALRKVLAMNPSDTAAYQQLPRAVDIAPGSNDATTMENLAMDQKLSPAQRAQIHYGLSRVYKQAGDAQRFIKHVFAANKAQDDAVPGEREFYERTFNREERLYARENLTRAQQADPATPTPIFIVGLPRSGTSLVEQIIAGDQRVKAGGELLYINNPFNMHMEKFTDAKFPKGFEKLSKQQMNAVVKPWNDYLKEIANGAQFVTDKTPSNYHNLGLLPLLFPTSKIISVKRDPMDVAFSILQQPFDARAAHLHNIPLMAFYIARYQKLMAMWEQAFGNRLYTVKYEDLVAKPEEQGKKLIAHCGLEWNDKMLDLASRSGAVHTHSAQQVKRNIYDEGVGAWRAFERDLEPVRAAMRAERVQGV